MRDKLPTTKVLLALLLVMMAPLSGRCGAAPAPGDAAGIEFFERKVRPLLIEQCYSCHSASGKSPQGGLLLDTRAGLIKGGAHGPALIPGKPDASLLIKAVRYTDPAMQMPPTGKLSESQIATLVEWVKMGAPDPRTAVSATPAVTHKGMSVEQGRKHWAFLPLKRTAPPEVKNAAWCRTPLDNFVLATLEKNKLTPNPRADRRALIRRAYFDLIGLPPTPEEISSFVNDPLPDAYPKLVDRLLADPRYGERWGRHWLDLARFAESHGYEQDYDRPYAYYYRDFVIKALNADLPYDRFVQWQLAGDEIAPENPLALMATGFLGAGTHATQITKNQVEKERYDELDDMLAVTGTSMLGLTLGCARCHDHKYDPVPTRDYYRMLSTFTTTVRSEIDVNMDPEGYRRAKAAFDAEHAPLVNALTAYERDELPKRFEAWSSNPNLRLERADWLILEPDRIVSAGGATFTALADGSQLATGKNPDFDTYTFTAHTSLARVTSIRLEALAHPSMVKGGPGRAGNGNFALTDFRVTATSLDGKQTPVELKLTDPKATFEQPGLPIKAVIDDDPHSAWAVDPQFGKDQAAVFTVANPVDCPGGAVLTFTLKFENNTGHNIGRLRLSASERPRTPDFGGVARADRLDYLFHRLAGGVTQLTPTDRAALTAWYRTQDPEWKRLNGLVETHLARAPVPPIQKVMVCSEGVQAIRFHTQGGDFLPETNFLKRGDPTQKGEVATQSFLQVLTRAPEGEKHWQTAPPQGWRTSYRRTALARWITDVDEGAGQLLARVIVNRLWQHHMGRGIVATPSDFGTQGDAPTHPELLDYLATELIRNGWHLKPIQKLIMTSAVYEQSAASDPKSIKIDPDNKLCWRHPRRRLEAEAIRDSMLAVSGMLDPTMYGPGTLDESQKRRSIYFFIKRSHLIPAMMLFDAPDSLQSIPVRQTTTVAPQALMLLNGHNTREYAQGLAKRIAPKADTPLVQSLRSAYQIALGRQPTVAEMSDATSFIAQQTAAYRAAGHAEADQVALVDFCQAVLCLNEFVYID